MHPSYYYLAQVSKFVRPGAVRLEVSHAISDLHVSAAENDGGQLVVVILNASSGNVNFNLAIEDRQAAVASKARTMTTLIEAR